MEQQVKELQPLTHSPPLLHARRFLRDLLAECVAVQPVPLKAWAFRHFRRYILGTLFRLEDEEIALATAGPSGHRFQMRLVWQGHTSYVLGIYEPKVVRVLCRYLRDGDTCIDVGAHLGYFTVLMARLVGAKGKVHAFEPMPETFEALQQNIRLNGLTNVCPERVAAGSTDSPVFLISSATQKLSWTPSVSGCSIEGERNYLSVSAVSLDHYFEEKKLRPNFMKIDVEGEELSVLRGAQRTLVTARPVVFVEVHDRGGTHEEEVQRFLRECGYLTTTIGVRNREAFCLALPCA